MTRWWWILPLAALAGGIAWLTSAGPPGAAPSGERPDDSAAAVSFGAPARQRVSVVARYAHDPDAFTQGLLWHEGKVYETTGQFGRSRLRRWDLETGAVELETRLDPELFGEGLALARGGGSDELIWLTWKAGRALRFDVAAFEPLGELAYSGEGWGLAWCAGELYRSDGTATLWRHDPDTFAVRSRFQVLRDGAEIGYLNELECTPRGLLANVWQLDEIVQIEPLSGRVTATIDARGLLAPAERRPEGVLNGIAYRAETDTLLLTGKYWPWLFEVVVEDD